MDKIGGGGLIVVGIIIAILGALIRLDFWAWLLDFAGLIVIIIGVVVVIVGAVKLFSGGGSSDDF